MKNPQEALAEIRQGRSKYQLEKFVVGQHDTPEMQYYQLLMEMDGMIEQIETHDLKLAKARAEIEELRETGKKSDEIEAQMKERSLARMEKSIDGTKRELAYLQELYEQYPEYTREEIEAAQPEYWENRLIRTAQLQYLSSIAGGIPWAQLEAMYQADMLPSRLEDVKNLGQLENKPDKLLTINVQQQLEE